MTGVNDICREKVTDAAIGILKKAQTELPGDVVRALQKAYEGEDDEVARIQLGNILKNIEYAREHSVPLCQDTGIIIFYVGVGSMLCLDHAMIGEALKDAVSRATKEIPLRPNAVHPLSRENSGDNTGTGIPVIEIETLPRKDYLELTVLPKGAGSENMSQLAMLKPSEGIEGIKSFVLESIARAAGNPCPPIIVGLGIGGTADRAMKLSKKALLREVGSKNADPLASRIETELLGDINSLGIGPMGLGGKTGCLAVNAELAYCHTASLPVAINIQCWAGRGAKARLYCDRTEFL